MFETLQSDLTRIALDRYIQHFEVLQYLGILSFSLVLMFYTKIGSISFKALFFILFLSVLDPIYWGILNALLEQSGRRQMPYGVLFGWGGFWVLGIALLILFSRYVIPMLSIGLSRISRSSSMERNKRTDVRNIQEFLPKSIDFDPARYINLKKGIFLGLNENRKPHFLNIPMETNAPHLQVIGTTGAYKGVALGLMGAQFLERGEAVFFFDPKNDEWAPHVLSSAAKRCGKQFYFINLNAPNGA